MKITPHMVLFWGIRDIYSNWHPAKFVIDGIEYAHVEQYMMAAKARLFGDTATEAKILATTDPKTIKALGRAVSPYSDPLWAAVRQPVVFEACLAKFSQNRALGDTLLATDKRIIVEASPVDPLWGVGLAENDPRVEDPAQWQGANLLGTELMNVRAALKVLRAPPPEQYRLL